VDAGYFDALGINLTRGRTFTAAEEREGAALAVVSREAARRFWPDSDPIGQSFREGERLVQVIGVAQDVKVQTLGETPQPFVYRPSSGAATRLLRVVVGTSAGRNDLPAELRSIVHSIDPAVAVFESKTMGQHLDVMLYPYRLGAQVGTVLGLFGLLLAAVGLYGVVAFGVARRTREFGIRMALGAQGVDVTRLVMRESGRVIAVATVIGLAIAFGVGRVVSSVLFGVGSSDPITFVGVTGLLATVALFAAWLPTRRATRVNPSVALREE
jgi:ABC-type antimicrobial peptide transport system permease subunit